MRKISIVIFILMVIPFIMGCEKSNFNGNMLEVEELNYDEIKDRLVRFHVIANSDSEEDQNLKLKVRDKVIEFLSDKLEKATTLDEARDILIENIDSVNAVAEQVIGENGYGYNSKTMLSHENFPDKMYGNYLFPQGNYEAFRIIIGNGEGQNWWCVMFPPLCFVDETKDSVNSEELKENINKIVDDKDKTETSKDKSESKNKPESKESKSKKKITFKLKIVETFKEVFN